MALSSITYDESQWPIVMICMPARHLTESELGDHLDRISQYFTRDCAFGVVMDVRNCPAMPAEQRRQIAERVNKDSHRFPNARYAMAIVMSNGFQRGVLSVINWLAKEPAPMHPCATVNEGLAWLRRWMSKSPLSETPRAARGH